ncbi:MAG: hypothetical protein V5A28_15775 [Haloarculaceae archaeon]
MSAISDPDESESDRASNVLLLTAAGGDSECAACRELLEQNPLSQSHVVLTTGLGSAADRLADWDADIGVRPAETTVVDVATATRSAAATAGADEADRWPGATVERVDAGDLLGLGERLDGALTGSDRPTTLCVHSVSDLLQSADRRAVFGFLEALTRNVDRAGAVAHYHLVADLHDAETVDTLAVLFDAVVDVSDDPGTE